MKGKNIPFDPVTTVRENWVSLATLVKEAKGTSVRGNGRKFNTNEEMNYFTGEPFELDFYH